MKTKKTSKTNTKSRIIFFAIALTYNLLLGIYLKDFLMLSPMFTTFYMLSVLPMLFLLVDTRSKILRAVIYILFFLILMMNFAYTLECRRIMVFATIVPYGIELIYFFAYARDFGKDGFLTKIYVLAVSGLIIVTLVSAYTFVCKPEVPYLLNGGATLWDTQAEELADEICAGCETDEEKVRAFYYWIISNFEYYPDYFPIIRYFDVRKTLVRSKAFVLTLPICLLRSAVVRIFRAMLLTECLEPIEPISTHGIGFIITTLGGMWMLQAQPTAKNFMVSTNSKAYLLLTRIFS